METKACKVCKVVLPANEEFFYKNACLKSGLENACKKCRKSKKTIKTKPTKPGYKVCQKCKREFPATEEYFGSRSTKSGLDSNCKECIHKYYLDNKDYIKNKTNKRYWENREETLEKQKEYYQKNKERKIEYAKGYAKQNKEKIREMQRKYSLENRKQLNAYHKKYYAENKDRITEVNNKWKQKNPDKVKMIRAKRRNNKKMVKTDLTIDEWYGNEAKFNNKCAYCGGKYNLEKDHIIPLAKCGGFTKSNIIPACRRCNASKKNSDLDIWYPMQPFYDEEKHKKIKKHMRFG